MLYMYSVCFTFRVFYFVSHPFPKMKIWGQRREGQWEQRKKNDITEEYFRVFFPVIMSTFS